MGSVLGQIQSQGSMIKWFLKWAAWGRAEGQPGVWKSCWNNQFQGKCGFSAILSGRICPHIYSYPKTLSKAQCLGDIFYLINGTFSLIAICGWAQWEVTRWKDVYARDYKCTCDNKTVIHLFFGVCVFRIVHHLPRGFDVSGRISETTNQTHRQPIMAVPFAD